MTQRVELNPTISKSKDLRRTIFMAAAVLSVLVVTHIARSVS